MPNILVPAQMSYIVGSEISTIEHDFEIWDPRTHSMRIEPLPHEFGFTVVTWTPADPTIVWELHWNTKEEREASSGSPGLIKKRPATDQEIEDGQRQHTSAGGSETHAAADEIHRILKLLARAAFVAEHLMEMIPTQTWRDHGAFVQGIYEGEIRAAQTEAEIQEWKKAAR